MSSPVEPPTPPPGRRPSHTPRSAAWPQFSVRTMLAVLTVAAVLLALGPYGAGWLVREVVLPYVVTVALGTFAYYARGYRQTFYLGAFAGALIAAVRGAQVDFSAMTGSSRPSMLDAFSMLLLYGACGLTAVGCRRYLERRRGPATDSDRPPSQDQP